MPKSSSLTINSLKLPLHIGVSPEEKQTEQTLLLDLEIHFPSPPKATQTDAIDDTLCYQTLCDEIYRHILPRSFSLVEHLAHEIYQLVAKQTAKKALINVKITKFPKISGLSGGICFNYGDKLPINVEREESVL